jgi:hypothetical protein
MGVSLDVFRRVFEAATAKVDKVLFTLTSLPADCEDIKRILPIARAAGDRSGAALRRVELPACSLQSFGTDFHDVSVTEGADVLRLFFERDNIDVDLAA